MPTRSKPKGRGGKRPVKTTAGKVAITAAEAADAVAKANADNADTLRTEDEQQVIQPPILFDEEPVDHPHLSDADNAAIAAEDRAAEQPTHNDHGEDMRDHQTAPVDPQAARLNTLMSEEGYSFAEAVSVIADEEREAKAAEEAANAPTMTEAQWRERMGMDKGPPKAETSPVPQVPAAPAKDTRVTFEVHLQPRHADWLRNMAHFEGRIRKEKDLTPTRMLEIIVREAYAVDPSKGGTVAGDTSGPRGAFNPASGQWDS